MTPGPYLTLPQRALAACVLDGLGTIATAQALGCCESAVTKRLRRLREVYGVQNRVQLAVAVAEHLRPNVAR